MLKRAQTGVLWKHQCRKYSACTSLLLSMLNMVRRPHTLTPAEIHLAHLMPFLEKQATEMNARLIETQQANVELLSTVAAQRAEIEALVRGLENVIHDLDASAQTMAQDDVQDLSKETRDLEMAMRT